MQNEKYTGDALFQKSFNDNNYHNRRNCGELPMYYHTNHHTAIISRETFIMTQLACQKRAQKAYPAYPAACIHEHGLKARWH